MDRLLLVRDIKETQIDANHVERDRHFIVIKQKNCQTVSIRKKGSISFCKT